MRIGENTRKCVVFFGVRKDSTIEYGGTGFLCSLAVPDYHESFAYLVTARHVARALERYRKEGFYLRLNTANGGSTSPIIIVEEWHYHQDPTVDLAAVSFSIASKRFDQAHYEITTTNWYDHTKTNTVVCGDDISIVGLFRLHVGTKRNVPFVHSGHVAVMPNPLERVPMRDRLTGEIIESEVFLIEAHTLDGLSGSPVFMHETVSIELPPEHVGTGALKAYGRAGLLGIYTGSWDGEPGEILAADRNLKGGRRVPVGMGTVVPAKKLVEMLREHPNIKKTRDEFIQRQRTDKLAINKSILNTDFTSLSDVESPLSDVVSPERPKGD